MAVFTKAQLAATLQAILDELSQNPQSDTQQQRNWQRLVIIIRRNLLSS